MYHSVSSLLRLAQGEGPGADQAKERLIWFERGRRYRERGVTLGAAYVRSLPRLQREAYLDGYACEVTPLAVHKSRIPSRLRAGSAEVRAAV